MAKIYKSMEVSKIEEEVSELVKSSEAKKIEDKFLKLEEKMEVKKIEVPGHSVTPVPTGVIKKWNTIDGLPPRYVCGNLTPVNVK